MNTSTTTTSINLKLCGDQVKEDRKIEKVRYLRGDEAVRLDGDHRGLPIRCLAGGAWITQEGDGRDHILRSGGAFRITHRGRVMIQGFGDAEVCVGV